MPKGRHTHYLRISGRMQLSGMRSHERNHGANIRTKINIAIYLLVFLYMFNSMLIQNLQPKPGLHSIKFHRLSYIPDTRGL